MARPAARQVLPDPALHIYASTLYDRFSTLEPTHFARPQLESTQVNILSTKYENFVREGEGKMPKLVRCEMNAVCLSLSLTNPED